MVIQGPGGGHRRRRRRDFGRRVAPWLVLVAAVGALAVGLGIPWWIALIAGLFVLFWIVVEP
ncbi:MAG: hypothetical protein MUE34_05470 [Acidimicrobiales bacterium]|jgi:hypothetical protein|nr:hypothetical protein [Acidimicrobiales bacterium]